MKWRYMKEEMTQNHANIVRQFRIGENFSWRAVASACNELFDGDWDSNQIAGMDLCRYSAEMFNEDYMKKPWN